MCSALSSAVLSVVVPVQARPARRNPSRRVGAGDGAPLATSARRRTLYLDDRDRTGRRTQPRAGQHHCTAGASGSRRRRVLPDRQQRDRARTLDPQRQPAAGLAAAAQDDPGQKLLVSTHTTRRLLAVFLRQLHSRSHHLQQTKNTTRRAQTRVFAGFGALFGKEPDREQREKTEPNGPEMGSVRGVPLKRPAPGTVPTLGDWEKNPNR